MIKQSFRSLYFILPLLIAFTSACSGSKKQTVAVDTQLNLRSIGVADLRQREISLSPDRKIKADDFAQRTSLRELANTKIVFNASFAQRFLTQAPEYKESYEENIDRLVITRELVLHTRNPCDDRISEAFMPLCFSPKDDDQWNDQVLADVRDIKKRIVQSIAAGEKVEEKWRSASELPDKAFLAFILNGQSNKRVIRSKTYVPYELYKLPKTKVLDLTDLSKPLYTKEEIKQAEKFRVLTIERRQNPISSQTLSRLRDLDFSGDAQADLDFETTRHFEKALVFGETLVNEHNDYFEIEFAEEGTFTDRYYFRFNYYLKMELGLRFPFRLEGKSEITHVANARDTNVPYPSNELCRQVSHPSNAEKCATIARVSASYKPVSTRESNIQFYRRAGVPESEILNGDEFRFVFGAGCSLVMSIPGLDPSTVRCPSRLRRIIDERRNFSPQIGNDRKALVDFNLSGRQLGLAIDGGFGYAAINPGISVLGDNGSIEAEIKPSNARTRPQANAHVTKDAIAFKNGVKSYLVEERVAVGDVETWGSLISSNQYSVNVNLAPSFRLEMGIDLGVYEWKDTTKPYVFDSLAFDLGRFHFDTHEGVEPNRMILSGIRDKFMEALDPNSFLVTDNGQGPDNEIYLCRGEGGGNIFSVSNDVQLPANLAIGDAVRINSFTTQGGRIMQGEVDYRGPTDHIVGRVKGRMCARQSMVVENACGQSCVVYTDNDVCGSDRLAASSDYKFSGDIVWRDNVSSSEWNEPGVNNCVIRNTVVEAM